MKLVQMPTDLIHLEDADLDAAGLDPSLLAAFRGYLPRALDDRRGLIILAPADTGGHLLLMVLARRIGAALRDANIRLRDAGGDLKAGRQKLCYLPGTVIGRALGLGEARAELVREAACFVQDLDAAWANESAGPMCRGVGTACLGAGPTRPESDSTRPESDSTPRESGSAHLASGSTPLEPSPTRLEPGALLDLLDDRLAAGRPTFLNVAPERLPPGLVDRLCDRLPTLTPAPGG